MFDRILVGWTDTPSAAVACSWAAARAGSTPLALVSVIAGHETGTDYLSATSPEAAARVQLTDAAETLRFTHPQASISTEVVRGSVVSELLSLSTPQTLIVVGGTSAAHKPGPFGWSIGARLAAANEPGTVAVIPADTTTMRREGIVVGYDGSPASDRVLEVAFAQALAAHEQLLIVHAWTQPPAWQDVYAPELGFDDSLEAVHRGVLDNAVSRAGLVPGLAARGALVDSPPAHAIVDAARSASQVVVGNHGYHGLHRLLLGSVSHAVVRALVAPTILVRA